jgi:ComF family protein
MKSPALFFSFIRELFFPEGCALCGKALYRPKEAWYGLCGGCREKMSGALSFENRCSICGRPLISEIGVCLSCRNGQERSFDRVITLFPYTGEYERLLKSYKFKEKLRIGRFFAECLKRGARQFPEFGGLVPVPPRPGKIKKNGWDQIEYLARLLEKPGRIYPSEETTPGKPLPVCRCLKRLPSLSQKELNRDERRYNLKGRIELIAKVPETAIIFDDVYTTGSTMDACAEVLKKSGARRVFGICLFYD